MSAPEWFIVAAIVALGGALLYGDLQNTNECTKYEPAVVLIPMGKILMPYTIQKCVAWERVIP